MEIDGTNPPPPQTLDQLNGEFVNPQTSLADDGFGTDAFLTLFLEQLQNQDPLNPQDTTEMTAQLATLTQVEQTIRQSDALSGVNERLDALIEATLGKVQSVLDPVSMIGRTVDVGLDKLTIPFGGESPRISIDVSADGSDFLAIEASDPEGQPIGSAVIANRDADGNALPLAPGNYQLFFDGATPQVRLPNGAVVDVSFEPLVSDENGNLVQTGDPAIPLIPGEIYDFRARINGRGANGSFSAELPTTTTGVVDSVRIVDGQSVLTIGNQEIDPTRIVGIR